MVYFGRGELAALVKFPPKACRVEVTRDRVFVEVAMFVNGGLRIGFLVNGILKIGFVNEISIFGVIVSVYLVVYI